LVSGTAFSAGVVPGAELPISVVESTAVESCVKEALVATTSRRRRRG
jgi:hypothetical protein